MKTVLLGIIIVIVIGVAVWFVGSKVANVPVPAAEATKEKAMQRIALTSSAFTHNGMMPERFTCDGENVIPSLEIGGVPAGTKTLALVMHDPDAPRAGGWTHWVKFNMKMNSELGSMNIEEGREPAGTSGKGSGNNLSYQGPCPPSGTHRYFFSVYALDVELSLKEGSTKTLLESAMKGHILGKGELIGLYSRKQ